MRCTERVAQNENPILPPELDFWNFRNFMKNGGIYKSSKSIYIYISTTYPFLSPADKVPEPRNFMELYAYFWNLTYISMT